MGVLGTMPFITYRLQTIHPVNPHWALGRSEMLVKECSLNSPFVYLRYILLASHKTLKKLLCPLSIFKLCINFLFRDLYSFEAKHFNLLLRKNW